MAKEEAFQRVVKFLVPSKAIYIEKDVLMQEIVNCKNFELFMTNIDIFTENEKRYLREKLAGGRVLDSGDNDVSAE